MLFPFFFFHPGCSPFALSRGQLFSGFSIFIPASRPVGGCPCFDDSSKPRLDGTRDFLASRGITLPEGSDGDEPGSPTISGLSNRKNDLVLTRIREDGVEVYDGSVDYVRGDFSSR